ncbi:hypothetical protein [Streptomyces sp. SP2-10]|uniref:hypothetical protein n=1 Tax=Streptomyces sp. SP2-10 TaxID=2873385 RepID=UPI001CA72437|nr:hypothetical protein [Streptomyces sp. SP2-10]MBY8844597.1 hypothetical protein [Streptomyces sp. SP2-10]
MPVPPSPASCPSTPPPNRTARPELPVVPDMPGKAADFLRMADLEPAERVALDQCDRTTRPIDR